MHGKRFTGMLVLLSVALLARAAGPGGGIQGLWKTVDDKTGQPRGVVHIYEEHGQYFGKIVSAFDPEQGLRVASKALAEIDNVQHSVIEVQKDLGRLKDAEIGRAHV